MRAFVLSGPGEFAVEEVDPPEAGAGHVVVDVARVGVCGTDVEFFTGEMPYLHEGHARYPIRLGHEWCGTVSAVGGGVDPAWLGRRVTGDTMIGCGHCQRCLTGRQHVCEDRREIGIRGGFPGALAEQLAVPLSGLHVLPDGVDDTSGAMVEPGGNALRAVLGAALARGDRALVLGPGTIGLLIAMFARAQGVDVHLVGRSPRSLDFARSLGFGGVWTRDEIPGLAWDAVIEAEPALAVSLGPAEFDAALGVIADFVDLKSPYTLGHGRAVSELVAAAAQVQGLAPNDAGLVRRAGLVHGLGRLGVSNAIWDRAGPLTPGEWERVRMYPYLTERMLRQSDALAPLGALALAHRERLDGSGYPLGQSGNQIPPLARLLGAAETYQTRREDRPHRPAHTPESTAALLLADVSAGRLDAAAVDAVLRAIGHRVRRRPSSPAGLTRREIEVLQLLARGMSNKQIAHRLVISPKTAGNHVEHIYAKINASNRASAGLFAMQHGLLDTDETRTPDIA